MDKVGISKPENLLLMSRDDPSSMCIADFGLARLDQDQTEKDSKQRMMLTDLVYTYCYRCPHVVLPPSHVYTRESDLFAMGITLFDIVE